MRTLSAKIVDSKIVARVRLTEGVKVTIFVHEPEAEYKLDEVEMEGSAVASRTTAEDHRAGRVVPEAKLLAFLRRP